MRARKRLPEFTVGAPAMPVATGRGLGLLCLLGFAFGLPTQTRAANPSQEVAEAFFESKVRPLLAAKCYACHRNRAEGGLRLDSRRAVETGGNHGPVVVPGRPEQSLLLAAVARTHDAIKMPPDEPLAVEEVQVLRDWIRAGARWPLSPGERFRDYVKPILEARCVRCHAEEREGELDVRSRQTLLAGGSTGPALVPRDVAGSKLIQAVRRQGERGMPPDQPLGPEEIAHLEAWVREGAPWPGPPVEGPSVFTITDGDRAFWSFQPLSAGMPPTWAGAPPHAIDKFIERRLLDAGLRPAPRAGKRTLLRRVTLDLTGLPPTPQDVEAFLNDTRDDAYERLVDRLLASRAYGERWGRHWLDLVRYADTAGDAADFPVPEAYKYRNYVLDAFQADMPYDQFVREQLAGDLLDLPDDDSRWRAQIATGYLAIARRIGVSPQNQRHIMLEDVIDNLGKTFLGISIGCARCHDHKFDPISAADYYALYGILDSCLFPHPGAEHKPHRENFVYRVGREQADAILAPHRARIAEVTRQERVKFEEYRALQRQDITKAAKTRAQLWAEVQALREERGAIGATFPPLETAYAVTEGQPHDVHLHRAGDPRNEGPLVRRGFLQILGGAQLGEDQTQSGRLQLANWIVDANNPLTARVLVNRVWHHHFGQGLVASTSDFGRRGTPPTHPELLDYLAGWFMDEGWSIKALHRHMVTSRTYRRASVLGATQSERDPENRLWWRARRRRLDAEQIRDSLLMLADKLDVSPGGAHPFPQPMTYFYRQHEPFQEDYASNRRTVYVLQPRIRKNPYLDLFDGPDGNIPFAERRTSTTTLQALFWMNSPQVHSWTGWIADRIRSESLSTETRVAKAYRLVFLREPTPDEMARAIKFFESVGRHRAAWAGFVRGMVSSNEFLFVD